MFAQRLSPRILAAAALLLAVACRSSQPEAPTARARETAPEASHIPPSEMTTPAETTAALTMPPALSADSTALGDDGPMDWWREARFGLFLHWGLYAVPAGAWDVTNARGEKEHQTHHAEWILTTAHIPVDEYEHLRERFDPVQFDAQAWVAMAKDAGMKYVVITSKHHDGFCLFESEHTDYDVMSTPFKRDIMKELAEACREAGLKMCWYHSIMDWHHPDYLPRRDWESRPAEGARFERYVDHLHAQVTELLTKYGDIGVMWFDGEWESTWTHEQGAALYELCKSLQPGVIVNNRVDKGRAGMAGMTVDSKFKGDFGTPEQEIPATGFPGVDWESCMTMNANWGFNAADGNWKSTEELLHNLIDIASKGGNFLLNVGPRADGTFPPEAVERLEGIGRWMSVNGAAIHGTSASPFAHLEFGRCTQKRVGSRTQLFLFVIDWPESGTLVVPGLGNEVARAYLIADPTRALLCERTDSDLRIALPTEIPDPFASVVVLEIDGAPIVYEAPEIAADADVLVRGLEVRLLTGSSDLEIRYTLDGTPPTERSPLYGKALVIDATTTVQARAFHKGKPVSAVVTRTFRRIDPQPGVDPGKLFPGLACEVYSGDWNALPDFDAGTPVASEIIETIELPEGIAQEYTGRRMRGYLMAPADDAYVFSLTADDGARLWIGGSLVVDNDGLHSPLEKRGVVALAAGLHPLVVEYFNKTGGAELELSWGPIGAKLAPVPEKALFQR